SKTSVANNLFSTNIKSDKKGYNHTHKEVCGYIYIFREDVHIGISFCSCKELNEERQYDCKYGSFKYVDSQILLVLEFGQGIPHSKYLKLLPPVWYLESVVWQCFFFLEVALLFPLEFALEILQIQLIPFFRTDLTLSYQFTIRVNNTCLNNAQRQLSLYITACITLPCLRIDIVCRPLEIDDGINRIAVIDNPTSLVNHQEFVEHFEQVRRRLVDVDNNQLYFQNLSFQEEQNLFGVH